MLINFLTVVSWIYSSFYLLSLVATVYCYSQLTARQKQITTVSLSKVTTSGFFLSVAFLVTKYFF
jgi:hypothetical protein